MFLANKYKYLSLLIVFNYLKNSTSHSHSGHNKSLSADSQFFLYNVIYSRGYGAMDQCICCLAWRVCLTANCSRDRYIYSSVHVFIDSKPYRPHYMLSQLLLLLLPAVLSAVTRETIHCQLMMEELCAVPSDVDNISARHHSPDAQVVPL